MFHKLYSFRCHFHNFCNILLPPHVSQHKPSYTVVTKMCNLSGLTKLYFIFAQTKLSMDPDNPPGKNTR